MPLGTMFYTCAVLPLGYSAGVNPGNPGYACSSFCFTFADPCDCAHDIGLCAVTVSCPSPGPGVGTPGYWAGHPEAWPVNQIQVGGITYSKAAAIANIKLGGKDKRWTIFASLVSAKLNVLIGNDSSCIVGDIAAGDAWWAAYHGSTVAGSSAAWKLGEPIHERLDAYDNGRLCAPARN